MFKGSFSAFVFYKVGAVCGILSLIIIYWQSQYYHQERPFPHRTISQVAQHYPGFLSFRLGTITGSALLVLGWFTNYFVLQIVAEEHQVNLDKYHPRIPLRVGITGGILLMGSTALIDTGIMFELAHEICATSFFILTFVAQIYNSVVVIDLQAKTKAFSQVNLYVKYGILVVLLFQLIGNFGPGLMTLGAPNDDKGNFYEWTLTVTVISMFLSIGMDASRFEFVYTETQPELEWEAEV